MNYFLCILISLNEIYIYILRPQFNTTTVFPNQPQWTSQAIDSDFDMGASSMNTVQSTQAPKVNNHQKNSERMSEDESKCNHICRKSVLFIYNINL